ncbi:hypothetical protein, partial [Acinetobacter baumannii]|uniref:hypothetical protein n=1 Tax=Acinetobacter baumannii TaxID=470 RepID=UPI001BB3DA8C
VYKRQHTGTGCSGTQNNNNMFKHQEREIRQESYLITKYEKARQDVGLFSIKDKSICLQFNIQ